MDGIIGFIIAAVVIGNIVRLLKRTSSNAKNKQPSKAWSPPVKPTTTSKMFDNRGQLNSSNQKPKATPVSNEMSKSRQPYEGRSILEGAPLNRSQGSRMEGAPLNRSSQEHKEDPHKHSDNVGNNKRDFGGSMGEFSTEGEIHNIIHKTKKRGKAARVKSGNIKPINFTKNPVVNGIIYSEVLGKPGGLTK